MTLLKFLCMYSFCWWWISVNPWWFHYPSKLTPSLSKLLSDLDYFVVSVGQVYLINTESLILVDKKLFKFSLYETHKCFAYLEPQLWCQCQLLSYLELQVNLCYTALPDETQVAVLKQLSETSHALVILKLEKSAHMHALYIDD